MARHYRTTPAVRTYSNLVFYSIDISICEELWQTSRPIHAQYFSCLMPGDISEKCNYIS